MKNVTTIFIGLLCCSLSFTLLADTDKTTPEEKLKIEQAIQNRPVKFLENKGQLTNVNHEPVPFVLFKVESPGMNVYITEKGLIYAFVKMESEHKEEATLSKACNTKTLNGNTAEEETIKTETAWINVFLKNGSIKKENIIKENQSTEHFNYFFGHCRDGIYDVYQYDKITIKNIYPNIDWVFYNSDKGGMKYDFVVHPGGNSQQIKLIYDSEKPLRIDNNGNIQIKTSLGTLTENAPYSYVKETKMGVKSWFTKQVIDKNKVEVAFQLNNVEPSNSETLIIDPQLVWDTFVGGGGGAVGPFSMDTDNNGNIYITGYTISGLLIQTLPGAYNDASQNGIWEIFIFKFSNSGVLLWGTYYGGGLSDQGYSIATDNLNNVYVTGYTESDATTFPLQTLVGGYNQGYGGLFDAFILKFNTLGVRLWATYYGGSSYEQAYGNGAGGIETDNLNNVYITGYTSSTNLPVLNMAGAYFDNVLNTVSVTNTDIFIAKFDNLGVLKWATYYGGNLSETPKAIAIDNLNNVYITGYVEGAFPLMNLAGAYNQAYVGSAGNTDVFILKFNNLGARVWATCYGGSEGEQGNSIAIDNLNNVYIVGNTFSPGNTFPVFALAGAYNKATFTPGGNDVFILKFNSSGARVWATYYGGSSNKYFQSCDNLAIDACGNVYMSMQTNGNMPVTTSTCGYNDDTFNGTGNVLGGGDIYIVKFSPTGAILWDTYIGGNGGEIRSPIAVDNSENLFVTGERTFVTNAGTYPLTDPGGGAYFDPTFNGGGDNAFLTKFIPNSYIQSQTNSTVCPGCNGSATISICGDPGFNYSWSNGNQTLNSNSSTNTISGLCPGTYTATVTNNCNQNKTATYTITGPGCGMTASVNPAAMCSGAALCPTLTGTGAGGVAPYAYLWSTTQTTQNINPCPASTSTYTVTISDTGGITATSTAVVTVNPAVDVTASSTNITCNGTANGSVFANTGSGTSPYTYSWSNGQTSQTATGLSQGNYTVTIADTKGCTAISIATIISPLPLIGQFTKGTASCVGCGCKEWLMVNATGGTNPYSYSWPDGYTNRYKNQLCPGNYKINIADKNGCSVNVNITAP